MYNSLKTGGRPIEAYTYILNCGNRISKLKDDLINETKQTFPTRAIMSTEPSEGEFLKMLVKLTKSKKGIEVGTFTGYSALCLAEGLPDNEGSLLCFDISKEFTDLARKYWKLSGLDHKIELKLESAVDGLNKLLKNKEELESYDFAYVDADKNNYDTYYEQLLQLLKPGGFIVFDNTLWGNAVAYECEKDDIDTIELKKLNLKLNTDKRVDINMLGISDGVTIVRKL